MRKCAGVHFANVEATSVTDCSDVYFAQIAWCFIVLHPLVNRQPVRKHGEMNGLRQNAQL
jgi:hypothetical protein